MQRCAYLPLQLVVNSLCRTAIYWCPFNPIRSIYLVATFCINWLYTYWFFPDLKEWISTLRRGKFVVFFSLLSLILLTVMLLKYPDYRDYQENHYKYQYLFYASENADSFKKYDEEWGVDSVREMRMKWVYEEGL